MSRDTPNDLESTRFQRPSRRLLAYYALLSLFLGPFFWLLLVPLTIRFQTLQYRFREEGAAMSWGRLFRREVNLSYARIQDIHLISNVLERWLGLARIRVQTASGNARAEMTIVGILDYETLRNELYERARNQSSESPPETPQVSVEDLGLVLSEVAEQLRQTRLALEASSSEDDDE